MSKPSESSDTIQTQNNATQKVASILKHARMTDDALA